MIKLFIDIIELFSALFCVICIAELFAGEIICAIASGVLTVVFVILAFAFSAEEADSGEQDGEE